MHLKRGTIHRINCAMHVYRHRHVLWPDRIRQNFHDDRSQRDLPEPWSYSPRHPAGIPGDRRVARLCNQCQDILPGDLQRDAFRPAIGRVKWQAATHDHHGR